MQLTNKRVQQVARALDDTQHEHTHYPKHPYAAHLLGDDKSQNGGVAYTPNGLIVRTRSSPPSRRHDIRATST